MKDILNSLKSMITNISPISVSEFSLDSNLADLNLDSVEIIELLLTIEEKYKFEFPEEFLIKTKDITMKNLIDIISLKQST